MENLSRGIVALPAKDGGTYVSWRLFGTDPEDIAFNLYRRSGSGDPVRLNAEPIAKTTDFLDPEPPPDKNTKIAYFLKPIIQGKEIGKTKESERWSGSYLEIPIKPIDGYRPGDASVADLDGDGDYELVLHQTSGGQDNSFAGITGTPILDAYEFDGTHLWRIDLGINIREGEHYTQFICYDLDGDGRAEVACKTADGSVDGAGKVIGEAGKDWRTKKEGDPRHGRILDGPEYLTVFDGKTGAALATADYVPGRDPIDGWGGRGGNGGNDSYGNRCDRFLACAAYLDGERPSLVMCRGVYGRIVIAAWDWRGGELRPRWTFDSGVAMPPYADASPFSGMGGHSLSVADVDADGRDEIIYQAMAVDDDGEGLYSTGRRHGDAMHVGDFDPDRSGLEVFLITENEGRTVAWGTPGAGLHDARTGDPIWTHSPGVDVRGGLVADIDPRHAGSEIWGGPGGLRTVKGDAIGASPRTGDWAIWWDSDPLRELFSRRSITKWNPESAREEPLLFFGSRGGYHGPTLLGDILGDWREEFIIPAPDGRSLRLFTTAIPAEQRLPTLMHDPQYRLSLAWQNVAYNKPPHPSFYLGHGMKPPPRKAIKLAGAGEPE